MSEFAIPHTKPIRFVKSIICTDEEKASVVVGFDNIPTLGMLIEAATQSSSGIVNDDTNGRIGFVVSLKNIKLITKPKDTTFQVDIKVDYKMQDLKYLSFSILKDTTLIAEGKFVIALQ